MLFNYSCCSKECVLVIKLDFYHRIFYSAEKPVILYFDQNAIIMIYVNFFLGKKATEDKSQRQGMQRWLGLIVSSGVPQNGFKAPGVKGQRVSIAM